MAYDPHKHADIFVTVFSDPRPFSESAVTRAGSQSNDSNEFQIEMRRTMLYPRDELSCELALLQPERWMKGLWGDEEDGWRDARTDTFLTFSDARQLIADRILELGLSPEKVHAHPKSKSNAAEYQQFWRLDFASRMEQFRK